MLLCLWRMVGGVIIVRLWGVIGSIVNGGWGEVIRWDVVGRRLVRRWLLVGSILRVVLLLLLLRRREFRTKWRTLVTLVPLGTKL